MLNLTDLLALTTVVAQGGVHAAAEKLHKTPSAVSQSIKRLESELNLNLFDRSGYRMVLTDAGLSIHHKALELLQDAKQMESLATLISAGQEKSFVIAVSHVIPHALYLDAVSDVSAHFAETTMSIIKDGLGGPHQRLVEERANIAIVCGNSLSPLFDDTEALRLGQVDLVYVINQTLFDGFQNKAEPSRELHQLPEIKIVGDNVYDKTDLYVNEGRRHCWVNELTIKLQMLREGKGWGRVPRYCVEREIESGQLVALPNVNIAPSLCLDIWAIRKLNRAPGIVGQQLWQRLRDQLSLKDIAGTSEA